MMRVEKRKRENFFLLDMFIFLYLSMIEIVFYFDTKYTYIIKGILNQSEQKKRKKKEKSDDTEYEVVVISCCFGV